MLSTNGQNWKSIISLFEDQVEMSPSAIALEINHYGDTVTQLSYFELNQRANYIATYLKRIGLKKETLIGVCLRKSEELFACILAIWKINCVYVPLSSTLSKPDFKYKLADSGVQYVISNKEL